MITLLFLLNLLLQAPPQTPKIWHGKTFFYQVYCKERNGFYTIELKGPKYYAIDTMVLLGQTDTIARNQYQVIVRDKEGELKFSDIRWVNCKLTEITETSKIKQKRITLFYNFLYLTVPKVREKLKYENIISDFNEYDKTGDINKVVQKYLSK